MGVGGRWGGVVLYLEVHLVAAVHAGALDLEPCEKAGSTGAGVSARLKSWEGGVASGRLAASDAGVVEGARCCTLRVIKGRVRVCRRLELCGRGQGRIHEGDTTDVVDSACKGSVVERNL